MGNERRAKVVLCTCGKVLMAAALPDAEVDKDVVKDFVKYAKQGLEIDYWVLPKMQEIGWCENQGKCRHQIVKDISPAQLVLF